MKCEQCQFTGGLPDLPTDERKVSYTWLASEGKRAVRQATWRITNLRTGFSIVICEGHKRLWVDWPRPLPSIQVDRL